MAVQSNADSVQVTLTSVTATITGNFYILRDSDIAVIRTRASVDTTLVLDSDYVITGEGDEGGFTCTLQGTNVQVGDVITIVRAMPFTQLQDIKDGSARSGPLAEKGMDELCMMCQELLQRLSKTLTFSRTSLANNLIPAGTNVILVLDENGDLSTLPDGNYGGIVVVNHGATASTARPTLAQVVYWTGSVEPTNASNGDLWYQSS